MRCYCWRRDDWNSLVKKQKQKTYIYWETSATTLTTRGKHSQLECAMCRTRKNSPIIYSLQCINSFWFQFEMKVTLGNTHLTFVSVVCYFPASEFRNNVQSFLHCHFITIRHICKEINTDKIRNLAYFDYKGQQRRPILMVLNWKP